jgi:hypothetical protein
MFFDNNAFEGAAGQWHGNQEGNERTETHGQR